MTPEPRALPPGAIAIVGMSGRFPGAISLEQFWRNLCAGVESITRFSDAELEDSFGNDVRRAPNYVKARPILPDVEQFDAEFFGMYPREAELTDPQHRLFLECAWEALESAGYDPATYPGLIGVFGGCSINTYFLQHVCTDRATIERFTSSYQVGCYPMLLGAGLDFLATRVSYKLDLKGPSVSWSRPARPRSSRWHGLPEPAALSVRHGARRRHVDQLPAEAGLPASGRRDGLGRRQLPHLRCQRQRNHLWQRGRRGPAQAARGRHCRRRSHLRRDTRRRCQQ